MKKRTVKAASLLAAGFFSACFSSAYTAREILGEKNFEILREQGKIQENRFKGTDASLFLLPRTPLAEKIGEAWNSSEKAPTLAGENLYLIPKDGIDIQKASVILRSVSKMEGMEYYSNGEKRFTVLYKDAYCIASPEDNTEVPDKTEGSADGLVQYCLLNDNSLGKTNYKVSYSQTENEVSMSLVNITPVSYGPIKAVKPGNLHINLVLTVCDDYAVVYMNIKANFLLLSVIEKRMQRSFLARLTAIYDWFSKEISGE